MRRSSLALALATLLSMLTLGSAVYAQLPVPAPKPIIGGRMPAVSPDGKKLAFVYRGDIWVADSSGGRASVLTRNVQDDAYPQFSPDGNWISFASNRTGNWDVFIVPTVGGEVRQITHCSHGDTSCGWSPNGKSIVLATHRDEPTPMLLTIDLDTLRTHKLCVDYGNMSEANYSPDGKLIVYGRLGFPWFRPRYIGSGAMQMWLFDTETYTRRELAHSDRQRLWPRFMPDGKHVMTVTVGEETPSSANCNTKPCKFVDSPARTPNIWVFDLEGKGKQFTFFTGGSVRFPNVAARTGDIVFEYDHDLWILKSGAKEPAKIELFASDDEAQSSFRHETITTGATEAEPSPDGKTFAFGIRGDIWTIAVEKPKGVAGKEAEIAHRLTDWVGDDSDFLWSQDGKKIYFRSDREFNTRVYELDMETQKVRPLWNRPEDAGGLYLTPDSKQLCFWVTDNEPGIYTIDLATGANKRIVNGVGQGGGDISWSPDMQWIAYSYRGANNAVDIWIKHAEGGDPVNVTKLMADHSMPTWSPDGKYLFFQSDREGNGLYALPLKKEPARTADFDLKFEKRADGSKIEIDLDDPTRRIRKISNQNPDGDLRITDEGKILFISGGDVWSLSYDGKESKQITTGGGFGALRVASGGKKAFLLHNGELTTLNLDDNKQEKVTFTCDRDRDIHTERKAAFVQFWKTFNSGFYDPNMHGRDWVKIRERYEPLLDAVETREEFASLLNMMVGELESSHSEVGAAPGGNPSPSTPYLGFTFDYKYEGPGILVDTVPQGAPGSFDLTRIKPGEYVMAIDGHDVTLDEHLYEVINNKQGREIELLVNSKPTKEGARTVKYVSMNWWEWCDLAYKNRIDRLRQYTEGKSNNEIGYVHLSGMMGNNQERFEKEVYEYSLGKKAMIIDVRFNGGGNISDTLVDWLERKPHGYYRARSRDITPAPGRAWTLPIVVLMSEQSLSNAEMFPSAMRARGLAKLVGVPTPGYVIWTGDFRLVDGTFARLPGSGVYRLDGSPLENMGEKPDYFVPLTPEDWVLKRDPMLDKALELLEKDIK